MLLHMCLVTDRKAMEYIFDNSKYVHDENFQSKECGKIWSYNRW